MQIQTVIEEEKKEITAYLSWAPDKSVKMAKITHRSTCISFSNPFALMLLYFCKSVLLNEVISC